MQFVVSFYSPHFVEHNREKVLYIRLFHQHIQVPKRKIESENERLISKTKVLVLLDHSTLYEQCIK